jgi:hypothetical protein
MEAWRAWLRRQKIVSPKYDRVQSSCRSRLTRVPSGRRNRTGPEPSWGGEKHPRNKKEMDEWVRGPFRKKKSM